MIQDGGSIRDGREQPFEVVLVNTLKEKSDMGEASETSMVVARLLLCPI